MAIWKLIVNKAETLKKTANGFTLPPLTDTGIDLSSVQESIEKYYLKEALELANSNESKAARILNINHHTFRYRRKKLQIESTTTLKGVAWMVTLKDPNM